MGNQLPKQVDADALRQEHQELKRAFDQQAKTLGLGDLTHYFWYHTINLGQGLITPGTYDFRDTLASYGFAEALQGRRVLDVGSATGFFAFELEKRGADVTSVEVPSIADLDAFPGETVDDIMRKMENAFLYHAVYTPEQMDYLFHKCSGEEFYHFFLDGPVLLCKRVLESRVKRAYYTIYELPNGFPARSFDMVLLGDVLLHTINPLKALAAAAEVCRETLIIAQNMSCESPDAPAMQYVGGSKRGEGITWWFPNYNCLEQLLLKLGFKDVHIAGKHANLVRPGGQYYHSVVVHAQR
jgi:tRNA (mo5U34)-methyltransferase